MRAVGAFDPLPADRAVLAALQAERCDVAARRHDHRGHRFEEADAADRPVAAMPLAVAAGAAADGEAFQTHRIAQFQHLGVGHARVGHVRVDRRGAVEAGAGAGAAADGLVVLPVRIAEQEVVHRRLRAGDRLQRAEQRVAGGLRHLGVAGDHRRTRRGRQERARRNDQAQRLEAAVVQRDVVGHQRAEHVQHRGTRHRRRRVEVALALLAGAGEIHHRAAAGAIDADRDAQRQSAVHGVFERAAADAVDHPAHRLLGVVHHVAHVGADRRPAVQRDDALQFLHALLVRRDLRLDVGDVHVGAARRIFRARQQRAQFRLAEVTAIDQQEIVDHHAFLFQRARDGRRGARRDAADIGVMAAAADEEHDRSRRSRRTPA